MKTRYVVISSLALSMSPVLISGATIPLFNTGVSPTGARLSGGSADPHWAVTSGPNITTSQPAEVLSNQLSSTYAQANDSRWIWVEADGRAGTNTPYTFVQTFDLNGLDPDTAVIEGRWGVDNFGFIRLNGSSTNIGSGTLSFPNNNSTLAFSRLSDFTLSNGFVDGLNTLEFVLTDAQNPAGFNVSGLIGNADAIPEPSSSLLMVSALAVVAGRRRRKLS